MVEEKKPKEKTRFCYECRERIGGVAGVDWHFVRNNGKDRYYCARCANKILRGE